MIPATLFGGHHFLSVSNYSPDGHERTLTIFCDCLGVYNSIRKVFEVVSNVVSISNYERDLFQCFSPSVLMFIATTDTNFVRYRSMRCELNRT